jgi:vacuolar-type H+-ATPase subunit I/STV1
MNKVDVIAKVEAKKVEVAAAFDALIQELQDMPEDEPSEQIAQLQAQVQDLQNQVVAKDAEIADKAQKLADVNALAKAIDEKIPD